MRFRSWVRYDIQGYTPCFRKEQKIEDHSEKLQRKKSIFQKAKQKAEVIAHHNEEDNDRIIALNICGVKYTTLRSTLIHSGSGYFKKIMKKTFDNHGKKKKKDHHLHFDQDGSYFIDGRNGYLFEPILNYIQS